MNERKYKNNMHNKIQLIIGIANKANFANISFFLKAK